MHMIQTPPQVAIPKLPSENPHYIGSVTKVGDTNDIIAHQDIFASNGIKLLSKGAQINSRHLEQLTRHRLAAPLDRLLTARRPVDATCLALEAAKIIEHDAHYRRIAARSGDPLGVKHCLADLKLGEPLLMRMTVMHERFSDMFNHSLRTSMIAYALAQRLRMSARESSEVLLAALCHDFGEMHTDPVLLAPCHNIAPEERRFVHVHPVTSYVLLHDLPGFPTAAAQAVLHHHERLDGSGYPSDLPAERIPLLAQVLAVADVAEAVMKRFDLMRLDMLFRLNRARFNPAIVSAWRDLVHISPDDVHAEAHVHGAAAQVAHLAELLHAWFVLREILEQQDDVAKATSPLAFLFERMASIRSLVLQAGFDPDNMTSMLSIAGEDPEILFELRGMLDEMDWLLLDLAHEIDRRSPELVGLSQGALKGMLEQLRRS